MGRKGLIIGAVVEVFSLLLLLSSLVLPWHSRMIVAAALPAVKFELTVLSLRITTTSFSSWVVRKLFGHRLDSMLNRTINLHTAKEYFGAQTQGPGQIIWGNLGRALQLAFWVGITCVCLALLAVVFAGLAGTYLVYYQRHSMKGGYRRYAIWCMGSYSMMIVLIMAVYYWGSLSFDQPLVGSVASGSGYGFEHSKDSGLYYGYFILVMSFITSIIPIGLVKTYKLKGEEYLRDRKEDRLFAAESAAYGAISGEQGQLFQNGTAPPPSYTVYSSFPGQQQQQQQQRSYAAPPQGGYPFRPPPPPVSGMPPGQMPPGQMPIGSMQWQQPPRGMRPVIV